MSEFAAGPAGRIERVRALMAERGYDAIVVRDDANLRWLTGVKGVFDYTFEFPHAAFITADQCLFHTDSRYLNSFEENTPAGSPWVYDMDEGTIPGWVAGKIAANKCRVCAVEDDMQINFYQGIQRGLEDRSVACILPLMHDDIRKMRAIKDAEEIELMRHAQSITDAAFQHMLGFIKPGMTEKQVRNELENFMFANGADSLAFGSIVASGPNTANPHAVPSDRVIEKGDFVLMDYGAGYCDYRSDMTRTVVMGEPTQEQLDLYALVRRTHEECVAAIHPGVRVTTSSSFPRRSSAMPAMAITTIMAWATASVSTSTSCPTSTAARTPSRSARLSPWSPAFTCPAWAACAWRITAWSPRTATSLSPRPRTTCTSSIASPFR